MELAFNFLVVPLLLVGEVESFAPSSISFRRFRLKRVDELRSGEKKGQAPLYVSIGIGPDEEPAVRDDKAVSYDVPDHEAFRTSRLSKFDETCDGWYGALLGGEDSPSFLGKISEEARKKIVTPVKLVNELELPKEDEEWTPYVATKLPWSPLVPAYGLEQYGLPIPRRIAEAWRHFDVAGMVETDYSGTPHGTGTNLDIDEEVCAKYKTTLSKKGAWLDDIDCTARLVYINGRFCPGLSKTTDSIRNLAAPDFSSPSGVGDELATCLSHVTDGFTDELAAPVPNDGEFLTSYKTLSGPDHKVGEPTSQFAINSQQGTACFVALNSVKAGSVALADVPAETDADVEKPKPILIVNAVTPDGGVDQSLDEAKGIAFHPRSLVLAGDRSRVSVVHSCVDLGEEKVEKGRAKLYNGYSQFYIGSGANVTHSYLDETGGIVTPGVEESDSNSDEDSYSPREIEANRPALRDTHLEMIDVHVIGDDGAYSGTMLGVGGSGRVRVAMSTTLLRPGAHASVNGFSLSGGAQRADMRTNIHHIAQGTSSRQSQKNMIGGRSTAAFRGRIRVDQSAQQTDSEQLSRTILLSDRARIWATPSLEIIADDVKCTHGATVSDLSEEELFYLRSRGISTEIARNMLMYAFVNEVSSNIDPAMMGHPDDEDSLKNRVIKRLQNVVPKGERAIMGEFQSV